MLNDEDINKLSSIFGTKEDFKNLVTKQDLSDSENRMMSIVATKQELQKMQGEMADLKKLVQGLIVSTDGIAKAIGNLSVEYAAISIQLSRHELWIKQIAEKVGLNLVMD